MLQSFMNGLVRITVLMFSRLSEPGLDTHDPFYEFMVASIVDKLSCSEIDDLKMVLFVEQEVFWLEVSVYDSTFPQELKYHDYFSGNESSLLQIEPFCIRSHYDGASNTRPIPRF